MTHEAERRPGLASGTAAEQVGETEPQRNPPEYPRGGDARRRLQLHHRLIRRPRWLAELTELCGRAA